jgi:mono/diheme cytochrome c family protein
MKGSAIVIGLLLIVLALLIGTHWVILPDPSQRNYEFFPNMVDSIARDAQSPPLVLGDGQALDLRPPEGSVARGYIPFEYEATPEGALLAGQELQNPFAADDADAAARGAIVFSNFCAVCHGGTGAGDGPVTRRGVPPPPSLLLEHAVDMADGQMFHLISTGQANMAAYASQVERDDRWRTVLHVRRLQAAPPAAPDPTEEDGGPAETETVATALADQPPPSHADEP